MGLLAEADEQEQDRRYWLLAQKQTNPIEAYDKLRDAIEDAYEQAERERDAAEASFEQQQLTDAKAAWLKAH